MEIKQYRCDICKNADVKQDSDGRDVRLQVIFTTEQTEGRSCKPYLSLAKVDICPACLKRVIAGEALWGHGAQGWNTYYFKELPPAALIPPAVKVLESAHGNFQIYTTVVKQGVDMPRLRMEPSLESAWEQIRAALSMLTGKPVKE